MSYYNVTDSQNPLVRDVICVDYLVILKKEKGISDWIKHVLSRSSYFGTHTLKYADANTTVIFLKAFGELLKSGNKVIRENLHFTFESCFLDERFFTILHQLCSGTPSTQLSFKGVCYFNFKKRSHFEEMINFFGDFDKIICYVCCGSPSNITMDDLGLEMDCYNRNYGVPSNISKLFAENGCLADIVAQIPQSLIKPFASISIGENNKAVITDSLLFLLVLRLPNVVEISRHPFSDTDFCSSIMTKDFSQRAWTEFCKRAPCVLPCDFRELHIFPTDESLIKQLLSDFNKTKKTRLVIDFGSAPPKSMESILTQALDVLSQSSLVGYVKVVVEVVVYSKDASEVQLYISFLTTLKRRIQQGKIMPVRVLTDFEDDPYTDTAREIHALEDQISSLNFLLRSFDLFCSFRLILAANVLVRIHNQPNCFLGLLPMDVLRELHQFLFKSGSNERHEISRND